MNQIDNISAQAKQTTDIILDDGSTLSLALAYNPATERWVMDVNHPLLQVLGINIDNFPNLLRQWRNLINFGLACISLTGEDPTDISDFVNGNATLYVLNAADVLFVETDIMGGALQ